MDRQLLLFDIFIHCEEITVEEIERHLPMGRKMIQRDIRTLERAGLISVRFSRSKNAYIHDETSPAISKPNSEKDERYLKRLYRLGVLMKELYSDDMPQWEKEVFGEERKFYTSKQCFYELNKAMDSRKVSDEKIRYRDFEQLTRIGYPVGYDKKNQYWYAWEDTGFREEFGVTRGMDGKLYFVNDSAKSYDRSG